MKSVARTLSIVAGVGIALVFTVVVWGSLLPETHVVSRSASVDASVKQVWRLITDHGAQPEWRSNVAQTERQRTEAGVVWVETYDTGEQVALKTLAKTPPRQLVQRAWDRDGTFSGRWRFVLTSNESQTEVTITESGRISNPVFRFFSRYVLGHDLFIQTYLDDLVSAVEKR